MRVLALVLVALAVAVPAASGRARGPACPHDASLGTVSFARGGKQHVVSLATCADLVVGPARAPRPVGGARSADGRFLATIRRDGSGRDARQSIWVTDLRTGYKRVVVSERTFGNTNGYRSPGPLWLFGWSPDDRWILFKVDPGSSASIAADGLPLRVVSARGGPVHVLPVMLNYDDYLAWCGGRLVVSAGFDRVATNHKRLLAAGPPSWRPRALWPDRRESFGSLACAPDGRSVAVQAQRSSDDAYFFSTRWQLWRVGLDGSRTILDRPPPGWADDSPQWSHDGRSLLFVREHQGIGEVMLLRDGSLYGPVAHLGYSLGYYGHQDWGLRWSAA